MVIAHVKTNAVTINYEMISDMGTKVSKRQAFNFMSLEATDQDFYDIGSAIGNLLQYAPKEILKNNVSLIVEA